ncbi:autoinducer binding domain-containing protein [Bradyrhizobium paxllaeri]|uniref:autoinducer binding domain-containing protein n=1 Tax=Bradyrhizobium paxllaeri TaxID=190148 RepID=UPI000810E981|nr:autoinducer binding domain-containing protein [Bradyrhizobium paxllaeri]
MKLSDNAFQEFTDSIVTARDDRDFERIAARVAARLGFRWFAYLKIVDGAPKLISSYPKSWTSRYFDLHYERLDPVIQRARLDHDLFGWTSGTAMPQGTKEQRRFFEEAASFGIRGGVTIPLRGGFGGIAAFTLATDDRGLCPERLITNSNDVLHLIALYFHTHLAVRQSRQAPLAAPVLSPRERQCIAWAARGKTASDTAVLMGISPRTVAFHLENARHKLDATSIAQCVAEALRRRLLT